ncbi:MAG TPA: winged helix-turn-helix domain-containing protein [Nitrososphaeraceae archaeon]|jgi:predicted transcriptional regulator
MKNRSRHEILASIINFAAQDRDGLSFTKLMNLTAMSHTQTREYLGSLVESGIFRYDNQDRRFRITEKGRRFLLLLEELEQMLTVQSTL